MTTYIVYFRNGGQCEITCEEFFISFNERQVRFVIGSRNIAIFETDAIVGFHEQQDNEEGIENGIGFCAPEEDEEDG